MTKKLISIVLAICMLLTCITVLGSVTVAALSDGVYLVGTFNGTGYWDVSKLDDSLKMTQNPSNSLEYMIDKTLYAGDIFKCVRVVNGKIVQYYPGGSNNDCKASNSHILNGKASANVTIYCKTNVIINDDKGDDYWVDSCYYGCLYIDVKSTPVVDTGEYYVYGQVNGENHWNVTDCKMTKVSGSETKYQYETTLQLGDKFKCVKAENGSIVSWYPEGDKDSSNIKASDSLTPAGKTISNATIILDWSNTTTPVTVQLKDTPIGDDGEYYVYGQVNGENHWNVTDCKMTKVSGSETKYQYETTLQLGDKFKCVKAENGSIVSWYPEGDKDSSNIKASDSLTPAGKTISNATIILDWSNTTTPVTVQLKDTPIAEEECYLVGKFGSENHWTPTADYKMSAVSGSAATYQITTMLRAGDEFKCAKKNADGSYTYFPSGLADDSNLKANDWLEPAGRDRSNALITLNTVTGSVNVTLQYTPDDEDDPDNPDGYYLVGTFKGNGESWTPSKVISDDLRPIYKLKRLPQSQYAYYGEAGNTHKLYKITRMLSTNGTGTDAVDKLKIVHIKNGSIDGWYPEGSEGDDYRAERTGFSTIIFDANGGRTESEYSKSKGWFKVNYQINEDPDLTIKRNLELALNLNVNFYVPDLKSYDSYRVTVNTGGSEIELAQNGTITQGGVTYKKYTFEGFNPQKIGDEYTVKVEANGYDAQWNLYKITSTKDDSVKKYLYEGLLQPDDSTFHRLYIALLKYGSAVQVYRNYNTDNLVDSELSNSQYASVADKVTEVTNAINNITAENRYTRDTSPVYRGIQLDLGSSIAMKYHFRLDDSLSLTNKVNVQFDGKEYAKSNESMDSEGQKDGKYLYVMTFKDMGAHQMRKDATFAVYDGDTMISGETVFSVESEVALSMQDLANGTYPAGFNADKMTKLVNLEKAMLAYGDYAAAIRNS